MISQPGAVQHHLKLSEKVEEGREKPHYGNESKHK